MISIKLSQNNNLYTASVLAFCLVLLLFSGSCRKGDKEQALPTPAVTVAKVTESTVPVYLEYVGTIQSIRSVDINARVEGFLVERAFKDGADVNEGDLLFVIDQRPFEAELDAALAKLAQDKATLAYAREQVVRYKPLVEKEFITQDSYDEYRTLAKEAEATVKEDMANVTTARLNLGYCTMRAPFDGRIGRRYVDVGNLVGAGGEATKLATIVQMDPLYVYFSVSERDIPRILSAEKKGSMAVDVRLAKDDTHTYKGKVDFIDNEIDINTGTVTMRATISNPDKTLLPGQFVEVRLILGERPNTLLVPAEAVREQQGGAYVLAVDDGNVVDSKTVEVGPTYKEMRIVYKGLKVGEIVIIDGLQKVKPGQKVKPQFASQKKFEAQKTPKPKENAK